MVKLWDIHRTDNNNEKQVVYINAYKNEEHS